MNIAHDKTMSNERSFLSSAKIWIIFTTVVALCGLKLSVFIQLWIWFYVAYMIATLLGVIVRLFVHPLGLERTVPQPKRPYDVLPGEEYDVDINSTRHSRGNGSAKARD